MIGSRPHAPGHAGRRRRSAWPLLSQCVLLGTGLAAIGLAPPASGAMLLLPLVGSTADAIDDATAHGARLLGAGRFGGIVVVGRRDALLPMLRAGTLVLAATPRLCGTLSRPETTA